MRNLFFITNLVRLIRLKLDRELTQSRSVIRKSHDAVAADVMEYGTNQYNARISHNGRQVTGFQGPNETIRDQTWNDGLNPY